MSPSVSIFDLQRQGPGFITLFSIATDVSWILNLNLLICGVAFIYDQFMTSALRP
jgi:hypothetical protein